MSNGQGLIISVPRARLRKFLAIFLLWQITAIVLGFWWGSVILKQSHKISELETQTGVQAELVSKHIAKTERMLFWESSVFVIMLFSSGGLLVFLFLQDYKRAKSLEAFFASFTHELKTPLASIRLQAETLAEDMESAKSKKHLARLLEDSMRLESQVEKTLELARVEGGGSLYKETIRIKPWLERFIRNWKEGTQNEIKINLKAEDVVVSADQNALNVIFKNLIENSFRHSGVQNPEVEISVNSSGDHLKVVYSDNGKGLQLDSKKLGKLYAKGPQSSGAGVGLYLTSTLMNKMGGKMTIEESSKGFLLLLDFPKTVDTMESV